MEGDYRARTIEVPKRRQEKGDLKDAEDWNRRKVFRSLKNSQNDLGGVEDSPQRPRKKTQSHVLVAALEISTELSRTLAAHAA